MRIRLAYANTDSDSCGRRLTLPWPHGGRTFSFDLGGAMRGDPYEQDTFCAEIKNYSQAGDQGTEFDAFLAKCYVAALTGHHLSDHFMWITWSPFRIKTWSTLRSSTQVEEAVLQHSERVFGTTDPDRARDLLDRTVSERVAERLWLIVLSDKQETLVPLKDWEAIVAAALIQKGDGSW